MSRHVLRATALLLAAASLSTAFAGCLTPPTGPPQTNSQAEMSVTSAQWRYDYPGSLVHSTRGQYYLNVAVSVTNRGAIPLAILAAEFSVFWQNETSGIPAIAATVSSTTVGQGETRAATIAFLSTELLKPVRIEFRQAGFTNTVSANVPAPAAPPFELMITGISSNWTANDTANNTAPSGHAFLWVNATFMDHTNAALTVTASVFTIADASGNDYRAETVIGQPTLQPFENVPLSILFEVPDDFVPNTLRVDIVLGPWTDAEVPPPA